MNENLVSIIVPVFNAEKYICRCLDSISSQTYINFEVILIDDGSTDISGHICDDYSQKDKRFRVIHQENSGVASARQIGLEESQGEYVIHADPDDWVEPNWIEVLYNTAVKEGTDITMCDFIREEKNASKVVRQKPTSLHTVDILNDFLTGTLWGICWNKLVRKDCFKLFDTQFIKEMNLWEDLYVFTDLVLKGATVSYVSLPLYHYDCFSNSESIVRKPSLKHIYSMKIYIKHFEKFLSDNIYSEGFYEKKKLMKIRCFRTGIQNSYLLKNTFPEINSRFVKENNFKISKLFKYVGDIYLIEKVCISQCLKGNINWGYNLYNFWNKMQHSLFIILRKFYLFR